MNINIGTDSNYDLYYKRVTELCVRAYEMNRRDILSIADEIMYFDGFPLHGAVYHYLIPALLLSTCKKSACHQQKSIDASLAEAYSLSVSMPSQACICVGACGAAMGVEIFWKVTLGSAVLPEEALYCGCATKDDKQALTRKCCKRCLYAAILSSASDVKNIIGVTLDTSEGVACRFCEVNITCGTEDCQFYFDAK